MTIGNHDFDSNTSGLINYTRAADFPILSANIDFGAIPELDALVEPHTVLTLDDGVKVCSVVFSTPLAVCVCALYTHNGCVFCTTSFLYHTQQPYTT